MILRAYGLGGEQNVGVRYLTDADVERDPRVLNDADDLELLLFRQQGVVSMRQLTARIPVGVVRNKLAQGDWQRVRRGIIVVHNGASSIEQGRWVASLAAGAGEPALLAGRTALAILGLKGFESTLVHALIPASRRIRVPGGIVVHRTRHLTARDIVATGRPPCTSAARSLVDAAEWARSEREAATVVAMTLQQRLTGSEEVREVLLRLRERRRRDLIWSTVCDAAGGAHSINELDALRLIRRGGLPEPAKQEVRIDATGRRRYLDLYWPDYGIHVEIDGSHHLDVAQAWQDAERSNALWVPGQRTLRFPSWAVRHDPERVLAQLRQAFLDAGWHPSTR